MESVSLRQPCAARLSGTMPRVGPSESWQREDCGTVRREFVPDSLPRHRRAPIRCFRHSLPPRKAGLSGCGEHVNCIGTSGYISDDLWTCSLSRLSRTTCDPRTRPRKCARRGFCSNVCERHPQVRWLSPCVWARWGRRRTIPAAVRACPTHSGTGGGASRR